MILCVCVCMREKCEGVCHTNIEVIISVSSGYTNFGLTHTSDARSQMKKSNKEVTALQNFFTALHLSRGGLFRGALGLAGWVGDRKEGDCRHKAGLSYPPVGSDFCPRDHWD